MTIFFGLGLVVALVAVNWSWFYTFWAEHEAMQWVYVGALISGSALALAMPSPWIGMAYVFVVFSFPLSIMVQARRWTPFVIKPQQQLEQQIFYLLYAAVYVVIARPSLIAALPIIAGGVIAFALVNWAVVLANKYHRFFPGQVRYQEGRPRYEGLMQMAPFLAWFYAAAISAAVWMAVAFHPLWMLPIPLFLYGMWQAWNVSAWSFLFAATVGLGWTLYQPSLVACLLALPLAAFLIYRRFLVPSTGLQARIAPYHKAIALIWKSKGMPIGSGAYPTWKMVEPYPGHPLSVAWAPLHSDWLQAAVEWGWQVPAIALLYLVTHTITVTASKALPFAWLLGFAAYAVSYFPLRVPGQLLLLAVSMAALDAP